MKVAQGNGAGGRHSRRADGTRQYSASPTSSGRHLAKKPSDARHSKSAPTRRMPNLVTRIPVVMRIIIVALLVALVVFVALRVVSCHHTATGQQITVEISKGASTKSIGKTLADQGIVKSANGFVDYVTSQDEASSLKSGTYLMTTGMSYEDAAEQLVSGSSSLGTLSIPEGLSIPETAQKVHDVCPQISVQDYEQLAYNGASTYAADYPFLTGVYNNSLEGYLFPKTYDVSTDDTADSVIRMQLDQFKAETAGIDFSYAAAQGLSENQVVCMASIIEEEAYIDSDRAKIASVIYNRLAAGMRLQLDSTVIYALNGTAGEHLSTTDTQVQSPYNTYLNNGLPPGPISNPGLASLQAAAAPEQTSYMYYVLTSKDGSQTFCTTYDEFLAAKETYKQVFGVQ